VAGVEGVRCERVGNGQGQVDAIDLLGRPLPFDPDSTLRGGDPDKPTTGLTNDSKDFRTR